MKTLTFALLLCMAAVAAGQQPYLPPPPMPRTPESRYHDGGREEVVERAYVPVPGRRMHHVDEDRYASPASAPIGTVACSPVCADCLYPDSGSKVHHLMEAARHLEAAGYKEQAAEVRRKAHEQQQAHLRHRIDQKLVEIEALKAEIARLESHDHTHRQVQIDVKLLEMAEETADARLDLECLDEAAILTSKNLKFVAGMEESDKVTSAIEKLRGCGSVKVLAEPSLVTVSGRPAFFRTGEGAPHPQRGPDGSLVLGGNCAGAQVDMLPLILADDKVRLEFKFRLRQPGESKPVVPDGKTYSRLRVHEIDTGAEIEAGKTLIIRSLLPGMERDTDRKPQFLLLLTPKILAPGEIPKTARADADSDRTPPPQPPQPLEITR